VGKAETINPKRLTPVTTPLTGSNQFSTCWRLHAAKRHNARSYNVENTHCGGERMDYSDTFMRQHEEMCQVVGSIVFSLVEAGHDSTSENIITVLRNGLAESGKWEPDQVLYLQLAIDLLEQGRIIPGKR